MLITLKESKLETQAEQERKEKEELKTAISEQDQNKENYENERKQQTEEISKLHTANNKLKQENKAAAEWMEMAVPLQRHRRTTTIPFPISPWPRRPSTAPRRVVALVARRPFPCST